jgi:hypothetical protein
MNAISVCDSWPGHRLTNIIPIPLNLLVPGRVSVASHCEPKVGSPV